MRLVTIDDATKEMGISGRKLLRLVMERRIPRPLKFFAWTPDQFERVRALFTHGVEPVLSYSEASNQSNKKLGFGNEHR